LGIVLVVSVASGCREVQSSQVPLAAGPVGAFLADNAEYRLLTIEDVPEGDRPDQAGFSALTEADLTGDGLQDVVAVLVTEQPSLRYAVVAFHQTSSRKYGAPVWLAHDVEQQIVSVFTYDERRVVPAFCIHCDSNPFFRWNGEGYELEHWLPGEQSMVTTGNLSNGHVPLRAAPSDEASQLSALPECTSVTIEEAMPRAGSARWYRVQAQTGAGIISGFLSSNSLTSTGCIG
jgi:hypothetical protein